MSTNLPISVIIPTKDRPDALRRTLQCLSVLEHQPMEIVICDASTTQGTQKLCSHPLPGLRATITYLSARRSGAAHQRNDSIASSSQEFVLFMDDDVYVEKECLVELWRVMANDPEIGGASAMITNQCLRNPGFLSRVMFTVLAGRRLPSYGGRVLGPAVNIAPEDCDALPIVVPVEWLNTGCTVYRKQALPSPPFPEHFIGYSVMEDLSLSLLVGKQWKLVNVRNAKVFHDSQPGEHKSNVSQVAEMTLFNRIYVMTAIMGRDSIGDFLKLALWLVFSHLSQLAKLRGWITLYSRVSGEAKAVMRIAKLVVKQQ